MLFFIAVGSIVIIMAKPGRGYCVSATVWMKVVPTVGD